MDASWRDLVLDGAKWSSEDDVYDAFFRAVGAPTWHGRNLDALNDSIGTGNINEIEVPYRIVIRGADDMQEAARVFVDRFADLIRHLERAGIPVAVEVKA